MTLPKLYLLLLLLSFPLIFCSSKAFAMVSPANSINYGRVNGAQLSDLAPTESRGPYDLLLQRKLAEATPVLKQEYAKYPDSLAAYVGLMQVSPDLWSSEISKIKKTVAHGKMKSTDLFKLGTLLMYQWGQQPTPPKNMETLRQAQTVLGHAWQHDHEPIIGLMLGEALAIQYVSSDASLKGLSTRIIGEQLIEEIAGPTVYSQYLEAKKVAWRTQPPSINLVPVSKRKALLAVITSLGSFSHHRGGSGKIVNGSVVMVWDPIPPQQAAQQQYMDIWLHALVTATKGA